MKIDIKKIFQAKSLAIIAFGLAGLIVLLTVLKVGIIIGASKADFSCRWSDNYHRNFGGPRGGFPGGFGDRDFIEANGTVGQIIKVATSTLVIKGRGDIEKVILVKGDTIIHQLKETITINDLKVDDMVVVIGEPNNDGQIEAKLVRVMPPPPVGKMPPRKFFKPF